MAVRPHLLYVYPWMPYPRRVVIYLRERKIPPTLVTVVPVSDPQNGDKADPGFPPRPKGSLPILSIPRGEDDYEHLGQSLAIMDYIEDLCEAGSDGFLKTTYSMRGVFKSGDLMSHARHNELLSLAHEVLTTWNPVRLFGTGLGPMKIPEAASESLQWVHRHLANTETVLARYRPDFEVLKDESVKPSIAEIVLYQFCEFTEEVYGVDVTEGNTKNEGGLDVYGRQALEGYPCLRALYKAMRCRESTRLDEGERECASKVIKAGGRTWWPLNQSTNL